MTIRFRVNGRGWTTQAVAHELTRRFAGGQEVTDPIDGRWDLGGTNDYNLRELEAQRGYEFTFRYGLPRVIYAVRVLLERWVGAEVIEVEPKIAFRSGRERNETEVIQVIQGILGIGLEIQSVSHKGWRLGDGTWTLQMTGEYGRTREVFYSLQASKPQSYHLLHAVGLMLEHRLGVNVTYDG